MNDKTRKRAATIIGIVGSSAAAMSVVIFGGIKNVPALLALTWLAGMLGHFTFTGLGMLLMRLEKRLSRARPGQAVYSFDKLPPEEESRAGGKGRALARLSQAGFAVPKGFILLPAAFSGDELTAEGWKLAQAHLARLCHKDRQGSFAVRSSASSEDSAQASFAGEFESVLDVQTDEDIRRAIAAVRRSRRSERANAYAQTKRLGDNGFEMSVVVQRLVRADFAGVLFTADPLTGNLAQMTGNYAAGLGEKLVSGQVSATPFTFERPAGIYHGPAELKRIAKELHHAAHEIENEMGCPQDIEWAVANGRLAILQSRPITTLNGYDPVTAQWNDTHKGNFLWSATNLMEACPEVLTPFTASLRPYLDERGGPRLTVKNYPLNGVIGGRFYVNLSVQVSAFAPMFKGDARRAYQELAGWWGEIPEEMDIPLIPLTKPEWQRNVLPGLWRANRQFGQYRRRAADFVARNAQECAALRGKIAQTRTPAELVNLWEQEIFPRYRDSLFYIVAASSDAQVRLEKELRALAGADEANALLSNLSGAASRLESLGPMVGLDKVRRGEMSRDAYLEAYGHRGVNEGECAWPRPLEDPTWLDRQLAEFAKAPADVESLLARQHAAYEAAWKRFCQRYPGQAKPTQRKLEKAALAARQREAVRSEGTRVNSLVRAFALRAGELQGLGENIFYLTIVETLAALQGNTAAFQFLPLRQATYQRYRALPPYPTLICGRFDPIEWAADPHRRSDLYNAHTQNEPAPAADADVIHGSAGALGVVEGRVRRLERLEDASQLLAGEILVTPMTNIGWTPLFPRAAAIVTDLGAPLSHAAIVARELGIPAVVGCGDATMRLKTGDRVRVNGGAGVVEILEQGG